MQQLSSMIALQYIINKLDGRVGVGVRHYSSFQETRSISNFIARCRKIPYDCGLGRLTTVLLSKIRDHLINFSSVHSCENLWMDGWFCWMAASVLSPIHHLILMSLGCTLTITLVSAFSWLLTLPEYLQLSSCPSSAPHSPPCHRVCCLCPSSESGRHQVLHLYQ